MNITKLATLTAALSASILMNAPSLLAQDASGSAAPAAPAPAPAAATTTTGSNAAGGGGGRPNFQQMMADRVKTALKATDDEWAVIQPLLQKVVEAQRASRGGMGFGGPGGRRGGGGGNGGGDAPTPPPTATGDASAALRTALESDATSNDDIKAKLAALRDARKKAQADLDAARADLQKVLTLRQEAVLVNFGILE